MASQGAHQTRISNGPFEPLLASARAGSLESLGRVLDECRQYLLLVANEELEPSLGAKLGASDLVQETFLEAQRDFARFDGRSEAELLAWLRRILFHNLRDAARRYRESAKRTLAREVPLAEIDREYQLTSGTRLANSETPSRLAQRREGVDEMLAALDRLPDECRRVIVLRNLSGVSFAEISQTMNRSPDAVRKLWARAVRRLEEQLNATDSD